MKENKIDKIIKENFKPIIGARKYEELKRHDFENMTTDEMVEFRKWYKISVAEAQKEIERYEEFNNRKNKQTQSEVEYFKKVREQISSEKKKMTKEWLWTEFEKEYYKQNKVRYSREPICVENIKPLIYYFIGDFDNFKQCKHVSQLSVPDQDKGLLIVGDYGSGKTSSMEALEKTLKTTNVIFKGYGANDIVTMFEECNSPLDKKQFWKDMLNGTRYFDDVLTERMASNYGKANIIKDIIEQRYKRKKRTYASINYKEGFEGDLDAAINQIGEKYGPRAYDRVFQMFNILEFKGNSFRK